MQQIKISILTSLYNCANYLPHYLKSVSEVCDEFIEVILLHNNPQQQELNCIEKYKNQIDNLNHILIPKLETLYASWNRGIQIAKGEFITIWNVDDIRERRGILTQAKILESNNKAGLAYGNYTPFLKSQQSQAILKELPEKISVFKKMRRFYGTPFMMWRKKIHQKIGYFDEQFRSAGDFDFWVRVARKYEVKKANTNLGYFLTGQDSGISKTGNINNVERTVVEIRYGMFDKLDYFFIHHAFKYSITKFIFFRKEEKISSYFLYYKLFVLSRFPLLIVSVFRFPFYSLFPKLKKYTNHMKNFGLKNTISVIFSKLKKVG